MAKPHRIIPVLSNNDIHKFWGHVYRPSENDCWIWQSAKAGKGYGMFNLPAGSYYAHRVSWTLFFGEIPDGMFVCHRCDNPPCVNPSHFFLGTNADNQIDSYGKGRNATQRHPGLHTGTKNGRAKLTESMVKAIRREYSEGKTQTQLAQKYGVNQTMIGFIVRKESWKHVA